ncbi:hypothetical protein [Pseudomonas sp. COR18]|uniref:hypothetical protein n=1 Tax=Pseudomonas sp. COR18 TaxID=3399680 RepID=UPI003B006211
MSNAPTNLPVAPTRPEALLAAASQKYDYSISSAGHLLNLMVPKEIREALNNARTVDEARATLSRLCRQPTLLQALKDISGTPIPSGGAAWAALASLVRATGASADWARDNGQASIAAFIAPGLGEQRIDFLQAVFIRVLLTQAYDQPEPLSSDVGTPPPPLESPARLADSAQPGANLALLSALLPATTPRRPLASTLLAYLGVYDLSTRIPTHWSAVEDYQFLRALPHFQALAARMGDGTTDTPVSPGQQAHLLIQALLATVEADVSDLWPLGTELGTADAAAGQGWHVLRDSAIRDIGQQLLARHSVDDPEQAKFLARLLLQRERPEWFLEDVETIHNDYARDVASITWRYVTRLCEALAPRSTLGKPLGEVVRLAGALEKLAGVCALDPGTGQARPADANELGTLSGLLLAESTQAWGSVWQARNAAQLLDTLNRVEQNHRGLLEHLGAEKPPDLTKLARQALRARKADPDERVQVTEHADTYFNFSPSPNQVLRRPDPTWTVSAVQRLLMKDAGIFEEERATVVGQYQQQIARYANARLPLVEIRISQILQQMAPQTLKRLDSGRWRVHQLSSRNAQLYQEGIFAVVEMAPEGKRPALYLAARKDPSGVFFLRQENVQDMRKKEQGGPLDTALKYNLVVHLGGKIIKVISEAAQDVPVEGIGLEPGAWQDGKPAADRSSLHPLDPGSAAWQLARQLAKPLWLDPMVWEAAHEVDRKGRAPWQSGASFSLWSLIPLYDYFKKPVAERGEEDHRSALFDVGTLFAPGAGHASRAMSLLAQAALSAARAGLLRTLGQGLTLKTVIGGLQGVINATASPLFRQGLRAGGLQLTQAAGETLLNISPVPLPNTRWFGKRSQQLWQWLPGPQLREKATRLIDEVLTNRLRPANLGNLSAYVVEDGEALLRQARPHRFNGSASLYHARDSRNADRWLIRYTDDTRREKVYEIKGNFKPQNHYVEIIDPISRKTVLTVGNQAGTWQRLAAKGGVLPSNGRKITYPIIQQWQELVKTDSSKATLKFQAQFAKSHGLKDRSLWEYVSVNGELADEGKFLQAEAAGRTFSPPTVQQLREWRDMPAAVRRKTSQFQFAMDHGIQLRALARQARKTGELNWQGQYAVDLDEGRTFHAPTADDLNAWRNLTPGHAIPWYEFAREHSINPKTFSRLINRGHKADGALSVMGEHSIKQKTGQTLRDVTAADIQAWRDLSPAERKQTSRERFAVARHINPNILGRHITTQGELKPLGEFRVNQAAGIEYHEPTVQEIIEWRDLPRAERGKTSRDRFALDRRIDVPGFQIHVKANGELTAVGEVKIRPGDETFRPLTAQDLVDWRDLSAAERKQTNRKKFAIARELNPRVFADEAQASGELKPPGQFRVDKANGVEFHEMTAEELVAWRDLSRAERKLMPWHRFALERQIDLKSFHQFSYTNGKLKDIGLFKVNAAARQRAAAPDGQPALPPAQAASAEGPPAKRGRYAPKAAMSPAEAKKYVAHRVLELQSQLPSYTKDKTTMAVALLDDPDGRQITAIASSNPRGYLPKGVTVKKHEHFVRGNLHAEADILEWAAQHQYQVAVIGAGRPICRPCAELIEAAQAVPATSLKKV